MPDGGPVKEPIADRIFSSKKKSNTLILALLLALALAFAGLGVAATSLFAPGQ